MLVHIKMKNVCTNTKKKKITRKKNFSHIFIISENIWNGEKKQMAISPYNKKKKR